MTSTRRWFLHGLVVGFGVLACSVPAGAEPKYAEGLRTYAVRADVIVVAEPGKAPRSLPRAPVAPVQSFGVIEVLRGPDDLVWADLRLATRLGHLAPVEPRRVRRVVLFLVRSRTTPHRTATEPWQVMPGGIWGIDEEDHLLEPLQQSNPGPLIVRGRRMPYERTLPTVADLRRDLAVLRRLQAARTEPTATQRTAGIQDWLQRHEAQLKPVGSIYRLGQSTSMRDDWFPALMAGISWMRADGPSWGLLWALERYWVHVPHGRDRVERELARTFAGTEGRRVLLQALRAPDTAPALRHGCLRLLAHRVVIAGIGEEDNRAGITPDEKVALTRVLVGLLVRDVATAQLALPVLVSMHRHMPGSVSLRVLGVWEAVEVHLDRLEADDARAQAETLVKALGGSFLLERRAREDADGD